MVLELYTMTWKSNAFVRNIEQFHDMFQLSAAGVVSMLQVRNPWGSGEMKSGKWDDDGPGWDQHPDVKAALNPVKLDDGKIMIFDW